MYVKGEKYYLGPMWTDLLTLLSIGEPNKHGSYVHILVRHILQQICRALNKGAKITPAANSLKRYDSCFYFVLQRGNSS